jgi:hypothetical protein
MPLEAVRDLVVKSFMTPNARSYGDERKLFIPKSPKGGIAAEVDKVTEMDRQRFAATQKVQGQASAQAGIAEGYSKVIYRKTVSIERVLSGEAVLGLEDKGLASWAMDTRADIEDKILLDMRNFLIYAAGSATTYTDNGGFSIDVTTADGLQAFHASHTLKYSATTYSNIVSGAPSLSDAANLDTAADFFTYNRLDNYGKPLANPGKLTIITSNKAVMKNRVARHVTSMSPESIEGTANANGNVKNVNNGRFDHIAVDFDQDANGNWDATKSFYWFLAALNGSEADRLQWYYIRWMSPMAAPTVTKESEWTIANVARAMYGLGAASAKGACVSKATA